MALFDQLIWLDRCEMYTTPLPHRGLAWPFSNVPKAATLRADCKNVKYLTRTRQKRDIDQMHTSGDRAMLSLSLGSRELGVSPIKPRFEGGLD